MDATTNLISSVYHYLDKREDTFLRNVFDQFSQISSSCGTVSLIRTVDGLQRALLELGAPMETVKVEELMAPMDLDENGGLDFEEFKRAVAAQPATQLEQWASMLPLAGILARSLPISGGQGDQPLRDFSRLREDQIDAAVQAFGVGLTRLLLEEKATLRQMFDQVDRKASEAAANSASAASKFKTFKMSTGKVAEYHEGLSSRIGTFS